MDPKESMSPMSTSCGQFGGALEQRTITHRQPWGDELYEFENVPAWVCSQCGETWLDAGVGQLIENIIQEHPKPQRYHQVPVFSLTEFRL